MAKSAEVPICLAISAAASPVLPCKAKNLACSKFNCLPVNNSASNSDSIEDWKLSNPSDILEACSKLSPNFLASSTLLAKALALLPKVKTVAAPVLATSSTISFSFKASLLVALKAAAVPSMAAVFLDKSPPVDWVIFPKEVAASAL